MASIGKALGAFQTLLSFDAPYDKRRRGEAVEMSPAALAGERLFASKGCSTCHAGSLFTDAAGRAPERAFHRIDLPFSGDQGLARSRGGKGTRPGSGHRACAMSP